MLGCGELDAAEAPKLQRLAMRVLAQVSACERVCEAASIDLRHHARFACACGVYVT
jgi:hypothetical protein